MAARISYSSEPSFQHVMLSELSEQAQKLFAQVSRLDTGLALLRFLQSHARTHMTGEDIAFQICEPPDRVERDLQLLAKLGVAHITRVSNLVLYGLTVDPKHRIIVQELCAWQDRWDARLSQMKQMIWGASMPVSMRTVQYQSAAE